MAKYKEEFDKAKMIQGSQFVAGYGKHSLQYHCSRVLKCKGELRRDNARLLVEAFKVHEWECRSPVTNGTT